MKRILSLMIVILTITSSVSAQTSVDTFVNRGDGKVVILDQRPKTIIQRPKTTTTKAVEPPVFITVEAQQPPVVNNYYPAPVKEEKYTWDNWFAALITVGLLAWFVIWLLQRGDKTCCHHCNCHQKSDTPPVINHFHVSGGNSTIDTSENYSNFQPDHSMQKHHHDHRKMPPFMGMFFQDEKEQPKKPEESPQ